MVSNEFPYYKASSKRFSMNFNLQNHFKQMFQWFCKCVYVFLTDHPRQKKNPFQRTTLDIINLNKLCLSEKVVADTGLFNVDGMIFFFFGATLKGAHANNDHASDTTSFKLIMSRLGRAKTNLSPSLTRCLYVDHFFSCLNAGHCWGFNNYPHNDPLHFGWFHMFGYILYTIFNQMQQKT